MPPVKKFTRYRHKVPVIVDSVITYTLSSLCELVTVRLMEAQANGSYATSINIFSDFTIKYIVNLFVENRQDDLVFGFDFDFP